MPIESYQSASENQRSVTPRSLRLFPNPSHLRAVLQALFVTFLWATSWVLIKFGLQDLPALTFAGLRYALAFLCLLPFTLRSAHFNALRALSGREWIQLAALGLLFYSLTQGAQFLGLAYLPAVTVSLLLNFTTIVVALLGLALLAERPARQQWLGIGLNLAGILIYFYPVALPADQRTGLAIVGVGVLANALSSILGRQANQAANLSPLVVTTVSMGVGALVLLLVGVITQGWPRLNLAHWAMILWLAVVNTAFAFTLWNHTLRTLSATESSIINSTMLVQIALLAWVFLGERITPPEGFGMALAALGVLLVQLRRSEAVTSDPQGALGRVRSRQR
ncbi:MAG: DMT family transporter [Anaerolineales bacterium]